MVIVKCFTVLGVSVPKGSTKAFPFMGKDGRPRASTTAANPKTKDWQQMIGLEARRHHQGGIIDRAVSVKVLFVFVRPKSVSKKKRPSMTVKPDLDKLQRCVGDALKGVLYTEDALVTHWDTHKMYGDYPRVEITVREVPPDEERDADEGRGKAACCGG